MPRRAVDVPAVLCRSRAGLTDALVVLVIEVVRNVRTRAESRAEVVRISSACAASTGCCSLAEGRSSG
jgi:hypothetical protein